MIVTSSVGSLGQAFEAGLSSFMVATGQIDWLEFELEKKEKFKSKNCIRLFMVATTLVRFLWSDKLTQVLVGRDNFFNRFHKNSM